eukprot:scaffold62336_cov35-Attheya_sp.AAC.1
MVYLFVGLWCHETVFGRVVGGIGVGKGSHVSFVSKLSTSSFIQKHPNLRNRTKSASFANGKPRKFQRPSRRDVGR